MELIGRLTKKFDTQNVSDKFKKREFILTTDESTPYPKPLVIEFKQDRCVMLDKFDEDDEVKVHFNLLGRMWEGPQGVKWFNTIEAWRMELVKKGSGPSESTGTATAKPEFTLPATTDNNDDLPF